MIHVTHTLAYIKFVVNVDASQRSNRSLDFNPSKVVEHEQFGAAKRKTQATTLRHAAQAGLKDTPEQRWAHTTINMKIRNRAVLLRSFHFR
jgi:hypothetical protein